MVASRRILAGAFLLRACSATVTTDGSPASGRSLQDQYTMREDDPLPASIGRFWVDLSEGSKPEGSRCEGCWELQFKDQLKITGVELSLRNTGGAHQIPVSVSVDGLACAFVTVIPNDGPIFVPCDNPRFGHVVRVQQGTPASAGLNLYHLLYDVRIEEEPSGRWEVPDVRVIICPFLSTLVNEGVLHDCIHTRDELLAVTMDAGLAEDLAMEHIEGNFLNNPANVQNICKMEGALNEHITSTMINDCETNFEANGRAVQRQGDRPAQVFPVTPSESCGTPNAAAFEEFWQILKNGDTSRLKNHLCKSELEARAHLLPVVDRNPVGEGTIEGSFGFLLDIFGEFGCIHKANLARLVLQRRFPSGYVFGRKPH